MFSGYWYICIIIGKAIEVNGRHYIFCFSATLDHAAYFQIARDVALGMNYLHLHRPSVLHLDLKSLNVLLNHHMRAKIADFGFSKLKYV